MLLVSYLAFVGVVPAEAVGAFMSEHGIVTQVISIENVVVGDEDQANVIAPVIRASGQADAFTCFSHGGQIGALDREFSGIFAVELLWRQYEDVVDGDIALGGFFLFLRRPIWEHCGRLFCW